MGAPVELYPHCASAQFRCRGVVGISVLPITSRVQGRVSPSNSELSRGFADGGGRTETTSTRPCRGLHLYSSVPRECAHRCVGPVRAPCWSAIPCSNFCVRAGPSFFAGIGRLHHAVWHEACKPVENPEIP